MSTKHESISSGRFGPPTSRMPSQKPFPYRIKISLLINESSVVAESKLGRSAGMLCAYARATPVLVNRAFLTSRARYRSLGAVVDLIVHDECHLGTGPTTRDFYAWYLAQPQARVKGRAASDCGRTGKRAHALRCLQGTHERAAGRGRRAG